MARSKFTQQFVVMLDCGQYHSYSGLKYGDIFDCYISKAVKDFLDKKKIKYRKITVSPTYCNIYTGEGIGGKKYQYDIIGDTGRSIFLQSVIGLKIQLPILLRFNKDGSY